jgi:cyclopropane-fatty-acyl-phospholipid synthase
MSHALTVPTHDHVTEVTLRLLDRLFPPPRAFDIRLWTGLTLPAVGRPPFTLVLRHPATLRRMFSPPIERSLGEAFMYGDYDLEGDLIAAFTLFHVIFERPRSLTNMIDIAHDLLTLLGDGPARPIGRGRARLSGVKHSPARDRAAVQYHYDVGNEFYALWLDRAMQYSCAYFPTGMEDLDTAQERKLDLICRKLRLQPGERLLDIGCGWGGLAQYAAEKFGAQVVGITLSEKQAAYANAMLNRAGLADRVTVRLQDYRAVQDGPFDKIVSIGMFEHVGRSQMPGYFAQAYRLLKPGGLFLNHGIAYWPGVQKGQPKLNGPSEWIAQWLLGTSSFSQSYIFPDGELEAVSEVNLLAEQGGFEVRDVENLREHYARTLRHWVKRLERQRSEAIRLADEVTYRTWRFYMAAAAYGFEAGYTSVDQTLLAKPDHGHTHLPLTRADLYQPCEDS